MHLQRRVDQWTQLHDSIASAGSTLRVRDVLMTFLLGLYGVRDNGYPWEVASIIDSLKRIMSSLTLASSHSPFTRHANLKYRNHMEMTRSHTPAATFSVPSSLVFLKAENFPLDLESAVQECSNKFSVPPTLPLGFIREAQTRLRHRVSTRATDRLRRPVKRVIPQGVGGGALFLRAALDGEALSTAPINWPALNATCPSSQLSRSTEEPLCTRSPEGDKMSLTFRIDGSWRCKGLESSGSLSWFLSEAAIFIDKFITLGLDFHRIVMSLPSKRMQDCVTFYYLCRYPLKLLGNSEVVPPSITDLYDPAFSWHTLYNQTPSLRRERIRAILERAAPSLVVYDKMSYPIAYTSHLCSDKALSIDALRSNSSALPLKRIEPDMTITTAFIAPEFIKGIIGPCLPYHVFSSPAGGADHVLTSVIKSTRKSRSEDYMARRRLMCQVLARLSARNALSQYAEMMLRLFPMPPHQYRAMSAFVERSHLARGTMSNSQHARTDMSVEKESKPLPEHREQAARGEPD